MLPQAVAVVDPHRLDDESGCEYLAGIGVAFKLICALEGDDGDLMLEQYGDLIAVATVADIVPLVGENRTIVRRGLESLQSTDNEGLAALIRVCGMADRQLSCENIAYGIVPRINSAGRFDCVDNAVEDVYKRQRPSSARWSACCGSIPEAPFEAPDNLQSLSQRQSAQLLIRSRRQPRPALRPS